MFTKRLGIQVYEFLRLRSSKALSSNTRKLHFGGILPVNNQQVVSKRENTANLLQNVICKMNLMQIKPLSIFTKTLQNNVRDQPVIGHQCTIKNSNLLQPNRISEYTTPIRTNVRCHFPRPSERKRIKKQGWKARMATAAGRRVIMRRILKGRHVLTH